jgi:putative ABC transport system permease protein
MLEANMVSPDYFRVMGMRLIRGRLFDASDRLGSPAVMVINDVAADRYFGKTDPIGQVVVFREPTTIIGVLQGVRFDGPERDVRPAMYTPSAQQPLRKGDDLFFGSLIIRTDNDARTLTAAVRETVRAAIGQEPGYPQFVEDYFQRVTIVRRFNASTMAVFGLVAAIVGALAVYGTMSFFVAQQRREISVRVALGATPSQVLGSALWHALVCAVIGVSLGLMATRAMSRLLTPFVFGVEPTGFVAYLSVGLAVIGIAGSAALAPAIRAARIDPAHALRHE